MRRAGLLAALAIAAMAAPAAAQDKTVALTPAQAMQCAVWAAYMADAAGEDEEARQALTLTSTYFIGAYEGSTGHGIAEGNDADAIRAVETDMERINAQCLQLMAAFGNRMMAWSALLERIGGEAQSGQ
jgi:hypothetical protein